MFIGNLLQFNASTSLNVTSEGLTVLNLIILRKKLVN